MYESLSYLSEHSSLSSTSYKYHLHSLLFIPPNIGGKTLFPQDARADGSNHIVPTSQLWILAPLVPIIVNRCQINNFTFIPRVYCQLSINHSATWLPGDTWPDNHPTPGTNYMYLALYSLRLHNATTGCTVIQILVIHKMASETLFDTWRKYGMEINIHKSQLMRASRRSDSLV